MIMVMSMIVTGIVMGLMTAVIMSIQLMRGMSWVVYARVDYQVQCGSTFGAEKGATLCTIGMLLGISGSRTPLRVSAHNIT